LLEDVPCREYVELVTPYLEGELDPARTGAFEQHELVCEGCARYREQIEATIDLVSGGGNGRTQPEPEPRTDRVPFATEGRAYKFLRDGAVGPFSGFAWRPNVWVTAEGPPHACSRGIHACRVDDLPYWLGEELWQVELAEPVVRGTDKVVAAAGKLVDRVSTWTAEVAVAFANDCAGRVRDRAVAALDQGGHGEEAERVRAIPLAKLPEEIEGLVARAAEARAACEYAGAAAECLSSSPFMGAVGAGYTAARAASQAGGEALRLDERQKQVAWLRRELRLVD
jgi:hypothetical protein